MDYKQKYEDAIERCKQEFNFSNLAYSHEEIKQKLERIFPELQESKDERIRKSLIKSFINQHDCNFPNVDGFTRAQILAWLKKQGEQKPINNIGLKFKVGDWIVNSEGNLRHIISVDNTGYQTDNGWLFHEFYENRYHLWTIQDAKDGDILVTSMSPEGDWIGMYKQSTGDMFKTHCYLNAVGEFVTNPNRCKNHGTHGLHPATKEQRDLLFQKIKEAGYEWDSEKKELKKIEQKLAWSEEDEKMINAIIYDLERHGGKEDFSYSAEINWLKSLKERMKGE